VTARQDPPRLSPGALTRLLQAWSGGDPQAQERLIPLIYGELRRNAAAQLRRERAHHTLNPTALVHETYVRLCAQNALWQNREQFFCVAARLMRRILLDHARSRGARKRDAGLRVTLREGLLAADPQQPDLAELDRALDELLELDERQAQLVELRFFGGLTLEEAAAALEVSLATANRDWAMAKAWLYRRLNRDATRDG
jgi:RNA polymerase sigma factor (TIGR02999 family)